MGVLQHGEWRVHGSDSHVRPHQGIHHLLTLPSGNGLGDASQQPLPLRRAAGVVLEPRVVRPGLHLGLTDRVLTAFFEHMQLRIARPG